MLTASKAVQILALAFAFVGLAGGPGRAAEAEGLDLLLDQKSGIDCRPICGTRFCCVAAAPQIPACVLGTDGNALVDPKTLTVAPEMAGRFEAQCLDPANALDLFEKSGARSLSCHWGCCSNQAVRRVFESDQLFTDAVAKIPTDQKALLEDQRARFETAINAKDEVAEIAALSEAQQSMADKRFCIFCCTF